MTGFRLIALFLTHISPSQLLLAMDPVALKTLESQLESSVVYTPDSDGYHDSLRRWSNTGIKPAVSGSPWLVG